MDRLKPEASGSGWSEGPERNGGSAVLLERLVENSVSKPCPRIFMVRSLAQIAVFMAVIPWPQLCWQPIIYDRRVCVEIQSAVTLGLSRRNSSSASGQQVWNTQPDDRVKGEGFRP